MNFINNINNNEFKFLTNLIFKEGINKKDVGCNKYIIIPNSITSIEGEAFYNCTSLKSIIIPKSIIYIGYWGFYNCCSLTSIIIPESVTYIEGNAFYKCSSLTSITIPESVTSIGYCTFYNCSSLTLITIPTKFKHHIDKIFYKMDLSKVNIIYT